MARIVRRTARWLRARQKPSPPLRSHTVRPQCGVESSYRAAMKRTSSRRAVYGFALSITVIILAALVLLWAYLPDPYLRAIGITYYPSKCEMAPLISNSPHQILGACCTNIRARHAGFLCAVRICSD